MYFFLHHSLVLCLYSFSLSFTLCAHHQIFSGIDLSEGFAVLEFHLLFLDLPQFLLLGGAVAGVDGGREDHEVLPPQDLVDQAMFAAEMENDPSSPLEEVPTLPACQSPGICCCVNILVHQHLQTE